MTVGQTVLCTFSGGWREATHKATEDGLNDMAGWSCPREEDFLVAGLFQPPSHSLLSWGGQERERDRGRGPGV